MSQRRGKQDHKANSDSAARMYLRLLILVPHIRPSHLIVEFQKGYLTSPKQLHPVIYVLQETKKQGGKRNQVLLPSLWISFLMWNHYGGECEYRCVFDPIDAN